MIQRRLHARGEGRSVEGLRAALAALAACGVWLSASHGQQPGRDDPFPDFAWQDLKRANKVDWTRVADAERFGQQWKMVPTRCFRIYFGAKQTETARKFAAHADNLWLFLRARAQAEPEPPLDVFLSPSKETHADLFRRWWPGKGSSRTSTYSPDCTAILCRPGSDHVYRLGSALWMLCPAFKKARLVRAGRDAEQWWTWSWLGFGYYYYRRSQAVLRGRDYGDEVRKGVARLQGTGWAGIQRLLDSRSSSLKGAGYRLASSVLFFIEERFGASMLSELWQVMIDARQGQFASVQALFEQTLGRPLNELENEWRRFCGLREPPPRVVPGDRRPRAGLSTRLATAIAMCESGQFDQALDTLDALSVAGGAAMSASEWAQACLIAGYAHDRKGDRRRAIESYAMAAAFADDGSALALWAEKGLVAPLKTPPFGGKR